MWRRDVRQSKINALYFNVDINNVRQRRNNVLLFIVEFQNVDQRRNTVMNMTICIKLKINLELRAIKYFLASNKKSFKTESAAIKVCTSNYMFKKEIRDKFTEFTFLKFWNLPSQMREISKFQKMNEVNFTKISRINMWVPINHMWQALKEHTRARITPKTINQYQQI